MSNELKLINLAMRMKVLKEAIDVKKAELKDLNEEYDLIRMNEIPDVMDETGVGSINIKGVGTVYLTDDMYVSFPDKEAGYGWLEDNGFGDIIKPYVFPQTLKAFVKEQLGDGNEIPEDVFKVTPFTRAAIRSS